MKSNEFSHDTEICIVRIQRNSFFSKSDLNAVDNKFDDNTVEIWMISKIKQIMDENKYFSLYFDVANLNVTVFFGNAKIYFSASKFGGLRVHEFEEHPVDVDRGKRPAHGVVRLRNLNIHE